jgi:uncharacterized protein (TIGR02246 family)
MRRPALAALSLALLASCQPAGTRLTDAQRAAVADTVRQLTERVLDLTGDADAWMDLFATGPEFKYVQNGVILSRDDLAEEMETFLGVCAEQSWAWDDMHVVVLGPEAAVVTAIYHGAFTDTAGQRFIFDRAVVTYVYSYRDGAWKIVQAHEYFPPDSV